MRVTHDFWIGCLLKGLVQQQTVVSGLHEPQILRILQGNLPFSSEKPGGWSKQVTGYFTIGGFQDLVKGCYSIKTKPQPHDNPIVVSNIS